MRPSRGFASTEPTMALASVSSGVVAPLPPHVSVPPNLPMNANGPKEPTPMPPVWTVRARHECVCVCVCVCVWCGCRRHVRTWKSTQLGVPDTRAYACTHTHTHMPPRHAHTPTHTRTLTRVPIHAQDFDRCSRDDSARFRRLGVAQGMFQAHAGGTIHRRENPEKLENTHVLPFW